MSTLSRRQFLHVTGAAAVALSQPILSRASGSAKRPNILFCISDDQTWLHCSAYGSKMVKTPHFDRVAREGVLFRNAFVSIPSCNPSRASVLTGMPFYRLKEASMNHTATTSASPARGAARPTGKRPVVTPTPRAGRITGFSTRPAPRESPTPITRKTSRTSWKRGRMVCLSVSGTAARTRTACSRKASA